MDIISILKRDINIFSNQHYTSNIYNSIFTHLTYKTLNDHNGCVNRLSWNANGTLLASVSDDCMLKLWSYPSCKLKLSIDSGHSRNMFGVAFLEGDNKIVTGGMDHEVRLHDIERNQSDVYYCHSDRIKTVTSEPNNPYLFWSAGEDGKIRQFDTRIPHACERRTNENKDSREACKNVICEEKNVEYKSFSLNPMNTSYCITGCSDAYLRLYDRRVSRGGKLKCMKKICPPNISGAFDIKACLPNYELNNLYLNDISDNISATHVGWSNNGKRLLATYHRHHCYVFDWDAPELPDSTLLLKNKISTEESILKIAVEFKELGNHFFSSRKFTAAIASYSDALIALGVKKLDYVNNLGVFNTSLIGDSLLHLEKLVNLVGLLMSNRAEAYIKRGWMGDYNEALANCQAACILAPKFTKSYYRCAKVLFLLRKYKLSIAIIEQAKNIFPDSNELNTLMTDVLKAKNDSESARNSSDDNSNYNETDVMDQDATDHDSEHELYTKKTDIESMHDEEDNMHAELQVLNSSKRLVGHCNIRTDIKEASFCYNDKYVACGSDDGSIYWYELSTNKLAHILHNVDSHVVNCLVAHPNEPVIATSGIANTIKIWEPQASFQAKYKLNPEKIDDELEDNAANLKSEPSLPAAFNGIPFAVLLERINAMRRAS